MKKLNLAIIGQGRSGRNIHGAFLKKEENIWYNVVAVAELDPERRERAEAEYSGCKAYEDFHDLIARDDIDLIVNASYSEMHYSITKECLLGGKNVLVEKPFGRNYYECCDLMNTAKEMGVTLAVFQQSLYAPYYAEVKKIIDSGILGDIVQINLRNNGFARRWDWQTTQKKMGGSVYNTGPHPIGAALNFLGWDENFRVEYAKIGKALTSGDAEDTAKIILSAPGKPVVDLEINSNDAFCDYTVKVMGTKGTLKGTNKGCKMKYIVDGENEPRPLIIESLKNEEGMPIYCSEKLITHDEEMTYTGGAFDSAVCLFYKMLYNTLTTGAELEIKPEWIAQVVRVIETVHAVNPMPKLF